MKTRPGKTTLATSTEFFPLTPSQTLLEGLLQHVALMKRGWIWLMAAWGIALAATLGALFMGEVTSAGRTLDQGP